MPFHFCHEELRFIIAAVSAVLLFGRMTFLYARIGWQRLRARIKESR